MIISLIPEFWLAHSQRPLLQRIAAAPAEVVAYVNQVNASQAQSVAFEPLSSTKSHSISPDFLSDISSAIAELPEQVKTKLEPHLLGVFIATGVGSSAITDVISDVDGKILGAVVLLDANAFASRSANKWMTWKESGPFTPNENDFLQAYIATPEQDHRKQALQYLLLHEFGHVLSMNTSYLPNWWIGSQKFKDTEEYSFLSICWQIAMRGEIIPLIRHDFEHRARVAYYGRGDGNVPLCASQMRPMYEALSRTGFPTLYAATTVYEDFAESFATYVHVVLMGKPWSLQIQQGDQLVFTFSEYWSSPRSQQKAKIFAQLFCS